MHRMRSELIIKRFDRKVSINKHYDSNKAFY